MSEKVLDTEVFESFLRAPFLLEEADDDDEATIWRAAAMLNVWRAQTTHFTRVEMNAKMVGSSTACSNSTENHHCTTTIATHECCCRCNEQLHNTSSPAWAQKRNTLESGV